MYVDLLMLPVMTTISMLYTQVELLIVTERSLDTENTYWYMTGQGIQ